MVFQKNWEKAKRYLKDLTGNLVSDTRLISTLGIEAVVLRIFVHILRMHIHILFIFLKKKRNRSPRISKPLFHEESFVFTFLVKSTIIKNLFFLPVCVTEADAVKQVQLTSLTIFYFLVQAS